MSVREWMTPADAAEYLAVSPRTLQHWRTRKVGPPFHKVEKTIRYHKAEIDLWLLER